MIRVKRSEYVNKKKKEREGDGIKYIFITTPSDESGNERWKTLGRNDWEAPLYLLYNTPSILLVLVYKIQDTTRYKVQEILYYILKKGSDSGSKKMGDDDWISGDNAAETKRTSQVEPFDLPMRGKWSWEIIEMRLEMYCNDKVITT